MGIDGFSPYDFTILEAHFGTVTQVREAIQAVHDRGMYVIIENTFATMADFFAFEGHENSRVPVSFTGYDLEYKTDTICRDFQQSNDFDEDCDAPFPRF